MRLKQLILVLLTTMAFVTTANANTVPEQNTFSEKAVQAFYEGRNDAYRQILRYANIKTDNHSIPGMPVSNLYAYYTEDQQSSYISGALFAYTHMSLSFRKNSLASCFASFSPSAPEVVKMIYQHNPEFRQTNVLSVVLNLCISTQDAISLARSATLQWRFPS